MSSRPSGPAEDPTSADGKKAPRLESRARESDEREVNEDRLLALADQLLEAAGGIDDRALLTGAALRLRPLFGDPSGSGADGDDREADVAATHDLSGCDLGHYRVDALIGQGGMGQVYRGTDELLGRTVAIKSLRQGAEAPSPRARQRLLREARSLARLDHPGICRIHDLLDHDGERHLVLEYVEGKTLREAIQGPEGLSIEQRLEIVRQIAAALAAAHGAGIVHRDLKPENVIVQPDGTARVLDFGIARLLEEEESALLETAQGSEDEAGESADEAGHRRAPSFRPANPSTESRTASTTGSATTDPPNHSTPLSATIDSRQLTHPGLLVGTPRYMSPEQRAGGKVTSAADLYALGVMLEEVLDEHPAVVDLVRQLRSEDPGRRPTAAAVEQRLESLLSAPRRRRERRLRFTLAVAGLALATASLWLWHRSTAGQRELAALESPVRTVVLPFDNATNDATYDWVEQGLRELVAESLTAAPSFDVVAPPDGEGEPPSAAVARRADATLVLSASLRRDGTLFVLDQQLATLSGRVSRRQFVAEDPVIAASSLVDRLQRTIDPTNAVAEAHSGDPFVDRLYAMAMDDIRRGTDPKASLDLLHRALELEPQFHRARLAVARAHVLQADWEAALAATQLVLDEVDRDNDLGLWARAVQTRVGVLAHQGDNDEVRREIAGALEALDAEPVSDPDRADVVREVRSELRSQLALQLMEHSRYLEAVALLRPVEKICRETGDLDQLGLTLHRLGVAYEALDQAEPAEQALRESLRIFQELGYERRQGAVLENLATVYALQQRFDEAKSLLDQSLEIARATGNQVGQMNTLGNRANLLASMGETGEALATMEEVLVWARRLDRQTAVGMAQFNIIYFALLEGRPEIAERHLPDIRAYYGSDRWDVRYMIGWVDLLRGRSADAVESLRFAKDGAPESNWGAEQQALLERALREAEQSNS